MKKTNYLRFITEVKDAILKSRYSAARMVNRELIALYWRVGKMLSEKTEREKWGAKVVQRIANDLQKELPGLKGFSYRNLKNMRQFYSVYRILPIGQTLSAQLSRLATGKIPIHQIGQTASAQLSIEISQTASGQIGQSPTAQLTDASKNPLAVSTINLEEFANLVLNTGFSNHILILNKCYNWEEIIFYMQQCHANGWTHSLLAHHIETNLFKRKGAMQSNFKTALPEQIRQQAIDAFRDEYLLDFINVNPDDHERVLENEIVANIRKFILSLGKGFTFIGNQHHLSVDGEDFFVDLLFYNRPLQAMVAVDLKNGKFKPEHAGKMNFYLSALDAQEKFRHESSSIGIILCREKSGMIVEYAFRDIRKPIGVATFKLSKKVPEGMKKYLPQPEDLKKLMQTNTQTVKRKKPKKTKK